jgi:hypothetical protein
VKRGLVGTAEHIDCSRRKHIISSRAIRLSVGLGPEKDSQHDMGVAQGSIGVPVRGAMPLHGDDAPRYGRRRASWPPAAVQAISLRGSGGGIGDDSRAFYTIRQ